MMQSTDHSVLDTLSDLIQINSVNPNYEGGVPEVELANYIDHYFTKHGIETWRQEVYPDRPNVLARVPGRDSNRRIVLEAHMDTVSVDGMTIQPWCPERRDGKMFGRGACDTKGPMAAMMHAVTSLAKEQIQPECDVLFAATIDEEYSYRGVVALCDSLEPGPVNRRVLETKMPPSRPWKAEAAIIAEPTLLRPVIASKGLVRWKIETFGKAAHSSKPHQGINAINHMAHLITAIEQDTVGLTQHEHPLLGPATCNIGVVRGGVQINFVPDRCEIEIERRMLPGENQQQILAHYQQLVDSVSSQHPERKVTERKVTMHPPMLSDLPLETDASSPAVQTMVGVLSGLGLDTTLIGVPFGSDASKLGAIGIPSMILGPGSIDQAHTADEYIECEQVIQATEIYRQFIVAFE